MCRAQVWLDLKPYPSRTKVHSKDTSKNGRCNGKDGCISIRVRGLESGAASPVRRLSSIQHLGTHFLTVCQLNEPDVEHIYGSEISSLPPADNDLRWFRVFELSILFGNKYSFAIPKTSFEENQSGICRITSK